MSVTEKDEGRRTKEILVSNIGFLVSTIQGPHFSFILVSFNCTLNIIFFTEIKTKHLMSSGPGQIIHT